MTLDERPAESPGEDLYELRREDYQHRDHQDGESAGGPAGSRLRAFPDNELSVSAVKGSANMSHHAKFGRSVNDGWMCQWKFHMGLFFFLALLVDPISAI